MGRKRLIRRYKDYLGIEEDKGDDEAETYRKWLTDDKGHSDEEAEKSVKEKFGEVSSDDSEEDNHHAPHSTT